MHYIPSTAYNPAFPLSWEGLDLESAINCTPRVYAVSSGNGNDGVSHHFPDYYVRTTDPYTLAKAAVVSSFTDEFQDQAADELDVSGEIDFGGIQACLYEPLDRDPPESSYLCEACGHEWSDAPGAAIACESCDSEDFKESEIEYDSWSDANGAYMLVDVWPLTREEVADLPDGPWDKQVYDGLESCFGSDVLAKATED